MRCGDHVHHKPTGEDWVVAYVDGEYLGMWGWPAGEAKVVDCTLTKSCTDAEHLKWLQDGAKAEGKSGRKAQEALAVLIAGSRATPLPASKIFTESNPG